jgi:cell division septum initiation protein DivIVA
MAEPTAAEAASTEDALPRTDVDLEGEIQDLHEFVRSGPSLMNHRISLDLNDFEERIERLLGHLPKEIKRARRIAQQEQRIIQDAKDEAARLLGEARAESDELVTAARQEAERVVETSAIKQAAIAQAEEIMRRAQQSANDLRERAFAYGRDVLSALETTVDNAREQIRRGQEQLAPPGGSGEGS